MNITRAPTAPFSSLKTGLRPHIAAHFRHAETSPASAANSARLCSFKPFATKTVYLTTVISRVVVL